MAPVGYMLTMDAVAPQYLMTMPLHAVTEVHGEAGLRQRFGLEIAKFPDEQQVRIREALAWRPSFTATTAGRASPT